MVIHVGYGLNQVRRSVQFFPNDVRNERLSLLCSLCANKLEKGVGVVTDTMVHYPILYTVHEILFREMCFTLNSVAVIIIVKL